MNIEGLYFQEKLKSYTPSLTDDSKRGRAGKVFSIFRRKEINNNFQGTSVSSFVEESEQFLSDQFDKDQIRARGSFFEFEQTCIVSLKFHNDYCFPETYNS